MAGKWSWHFALTVAIATMSLCVTARGQTSRPAASGANLLDAKGPWHCFMAWKPEVVRTESGELTTVGLQAGAPPAGGQTPLPPADWAAGDFDDSPWARFQGGPLGGSHSLALVCLRGRFEIADPAKIGDLSLSLAYRGGAVVYLNGKQVARANMTGSSSQPDLEALAEDYPKDAYVDGEGKLLRYGYDNKTLPDRFALRDRRLEATLPASLLRPGTNVLAVELHRPAVHESYIKSRSRIGMENVYCGWAMLQLQDLKLAAPAGGPSASAAGRPAGFHVWNSSPTTIVSPQEFAGVQEKLAPVVLVGCRNGSFSGQIVAGSTEPIKDLKVQAGPLSNAAGVQIPAQAVQVRYTQTNKSVPQRTVGLDALEEAAPADATAGGVGAIQPIWITVHVPRGAQASDYAGPLTVRVSGGQAETQIKLKVIDYTLPDSREFCSHVGLIQSPDSVALRYNVPLWSDEHWRLLEKSFALLGRAGTDEVFIPLICGTYHGNEQTMVRWIRQADGQFTYDFSVAEKYLDLAVKHLGRPPVVCLYIWDRQGGVWGVAAGGDLGKSQPIPKVSRLDPASGKVERMNAPEWGTADAVAFWKPVIDGMRERIRKRGLDGSTMWGVALDHRPSKATVADLDALAPGVKWVLHSHAGPQSTITSVGYGAHVWVSYRLTDPGVRRNKPFWQAPYIFTGFPRGGVGGIGPVYNEDPAVYRNVTEGLMACGHYGFGRVGADFWNLPVEGKARPRDIIGGDAGDTSVTLHNSSPALLAPGAAGPVSTVRFEMICEGVQECEARAFIEKTLADGPAKAKLGDDLARRCQELLDHRTRNLLRWMGSNPSPAACPPDWSVFRAAPWQQESEKLYSLAAELKSSLGMK